MRDLWNRISVGWCRQRHAEPLWPMHGHYHCAACFRAFPVPWGEGDDFLRRERAMAGKRRTGDGSAHQPHRVREFLQ